MLGNTSSPIIFYIDNTSLTPESVTLFMSSQNRSSANFGQSPFISIYFAFPNYTYQRLLADSENQSFRIWKMRYDIWMAAPPDNSAVEQIYYISKLESDGSITTDPLQPYQDLDQTVSTAVEFRYPIIIEADKGITFIMPAASGAPLPIPDYNFSGGGGGLTGGFVFRMRVMVWTDKNVSYSNDLNGDQHVKEFVKPMPLELKAPYIFMVDSAYEDVGQIIYTPDRNMDYRRKSKK